MRKSNLLDLIDSVNNGENTLHINIVRDFIEDLFQDALLNISQNHNRPDFDGEMYRYQESSFKVIKSFSCHASVTTTLRFNAILEWKYDKYKEEYSNLTVEIINPLLMTIGLKINLNEYLPPMMVKKAILQSANGLAVENWNLKGFPQP